MNFQRVVHVEFDTFLYMLNANL